MVPTNQLSKNVGRKIIYQRKSKQMYQIYNTMTEIFILGLEIIGKKVQNKSENHLRFCVR